MLRAVSVPDETTERPLAAVTFIRIGAASAPRVKNQLFGVGYQNESGKNCEPTDEIAAKRRVIFNSKFVIDSSRDRSARGNRTEPHSTDSLQARSPNLSSLRSLKNQRPHHLSLLPKFLRTGEIRSVNVPAGALDTFLRFRTALTVMLRDLSSCGSVTLRSYFCTCQVADAVRVGVCENADAKSNAVKTM